MPDLFGNAWPEQKGKRSGEPHAVSDFRSAVYGRNRVLEVDTKQGDIALDGERAACGALGNPSFSKLSLSNTMHVASVQLLSFSLILVLVHRAIRVILHSSKIF
ncbi:hypothetical protein O0882_14695 [Janthinobacterium sp. SUN073]|uniref:hypothetical protein n=1 Tax=Janthinobacterium sp. SUN073 TaxID=3004102 RepID=UPI0025B1B9A0|nr:hypothetical protein [Janthinobacterium sp. SUN073]MDN2697569.1 hypothetical protein [Janthinobacterium sp. SUN073]